MICLDGVRRAAPLYIIGTRASGHVYQNAKSVPNGSAALPHSLFVSVSAILTETKSQACSAQKKVTTQVAPDS